MCWHTLVPCLIPPSLVLLSLKPHTWPCLCLHIHLLNLLSIVPLLSSSSLCPLLFCPLHLLCLSLHLCCSLYVQGAVTAWDRGQAPLQEELRDSHHERRESCQSGLHIAAGGGASSRGSGLVLTQGGGALGKLTAPPKYTPPSPLI